MSSGYCPDDYIVASARALDMRRESDQPGSFLDTSNRGTDADEWPSQQVGPEKSEKPKKKERKQRTSFPEWKVQRLNKAFFQHNYYVSNCERAKLASILQITEEQVKIWFQNKRTTIKRARSVNAGNSVQNIEVSRAVPKSWGRPRRVESVSLQGMGIEQKYTLLSERNTVVCSATAKSPVDALQEMLVKIKETSQARPSSSVADCNQPESLEPEVPVATTSQAISSTSCQ
ncbi:homeobox domain-containing protein [Endozoicomonas sp. SCSIO W0465]|uniref:homeobox domain-containing protein n=1 Tax=Endozoicomonas sp. SCSIO W0465 TaxID=2918516 RepID=UPI0020764D03|nr:homeobox domain-containing protein [Endozoicomonas sp. SCSIO W0465]USE36932.1 homeobox domain-containing protein [Endozoicomonas sp. SCSIO W0465]USE38751.1 homeobox domain-containing protein [Endozoicomonas sp. SCSIO W0465]